MPLKPLPPNVFDEPTPPQNKESYLDLIRRLVAGGVRVAGPWAGANIGMGTGAVLAGAAATPETVGIGTIPAAIGGGLAGRMLGGAIGGAISEPIAEFIEPGSFHNWGLRRTGIAAATQAATGAVPIPWLMKGRVALQGLKGAALATTGMVGNKVAAGEPVSEAANPLNWSKSDWAWGPGTGLVIGSSLGALNQRLHPEAQPPTPQATNSTPSPTNYSKPSGLRIALDTLKSPAGKEVNPDTLAMHAALEREQLRNPRGPISSEIGPPAPKIMDKSGAVFESGTPIGTRDTRSIVQKEKDYSDAMELISQEAIAEDKAQGLANKEIVDKNKAQEVANKMVGKEKSDAAKAEAKYVSDQTRQAEKFEDSSRRVDARSAKTMLATQKAEGAAQTQAINLEREKQLAHDAALTEDAKRTDAGIAQSDAERQTSEIERLRGTLNTEQEPSAISETVTGAGLRGGKARATFRDVAEPPPDTETPAAPTAKPYTIDQIPPKEDAAKTSFANRKTAKKVADFYGGADAGIDVKPIPGGGYRIDFPDIEPPVEPPVEPVVETQSPPPQPKSPKGGGAADTLEAQRPWFQISEDERVGLVPILRNAIDKGFRGDLEQLADELAGRLSATKDGMELGRESGRRASTLLQAIRKLGGISTKAETANKGEIEWLKEAFDNGRKNMKSGNGIFNNKTGLPLDGILEGLKQEGRFNHINSINDLLVEIQKAARGPAKEQSALEELANGLGEKWWEPPSISEVAPTAKAQSVTSPDPVMDEILERNAGSPEAPTPKINPAGHGTIVQGRYTVDSRGSIIDSKTGTVLGTFTNPDQAQALANEMNAVPSNGVEPPIPGLEGVAGIENPTPQVANLPKPSLNLTPPPTQKPKEGELFGTPPPKPRVGKQVEPGGLPLEQGTRVEKDLADIQERTGLTAGQKQFEPGKVVSNPRTGAIISAVENKAPTAALTARPALSAEDLAKMSPEESAAFRKFYETKPVAGPAQGGKLKWETAKFEDPYIDPNQPSPENQIETLKNEVSKGKKGTTISAFGAGQFDNLLQIAKENPIFVARLGLGTAGAIAGAVANPDNPLGGALIGAGAGAFAPTVARALIGLARDGDLSESMAGKAAEKIKDSAESFFRLIPDYQRFSLLAHDVNLPMNVWVGPYGSVVHAAIEHSLQLDKRGFAALKLLNPVSFMKRWANSLEEAAAHISQSEERTEGLMGQEGPGWWKKATGLPGIYMTAGDIAARDILMEAGFTEEEARRITLTSEPYMTIGRPISAFKKSAQTEGGIKSWFWNMALPFYRTGTNQLEQGIERIPFFGAWAQYHMKDIADPKAAILAQQFMGFGEVGIGFVLGLSIPKEQSKYVLKFLNNFGGQYGIPLTLGFAIGNAKREGTSYIGAGLERLTQRDLPMPSTSTAYDIGTNARAALEGDKDYKLPRFVIPGIFDPNEPLSIPQAIATAKEGYDKLSGNVQPTSGLRVSPLPRLGQRKLIPLPPRKK